MRAREILSEMYIAYELDKKSRQALAAVFPPKYADFVGHHITLRMAKKNDSKLPSMPNSVKVVGYADDGDGLEVLVVEINGKTSRPDGKTFHITWSLDRSKGKKPVHSNGLVANGFTRVDPIDIKAKPELFT
jgi:hypothetical protein